MAAPDASAHAAGRPAGPMRSLDDEVAAFFALDTGLLRDPYPLYARLREEAPAYWLESSGSVVLTPHRLIKEVWRDPNRFAARGGIPAYANARELLSSEENRFADELLAFASRYMASVDGAAHTRIRRAVQPAFTPKRIQQMTQSTERLTDELLAEVMGQEQPDLKQLAWLLPAYVIMDLLGAPREDAALLKRFSDDVSSWFAVTPWQPQRVRESHSSLLEFQEYARELVEDHRRHPRPDLTSALLEAERLGEIVAEEVAPQFVLVMFAGHTTTGNLIATGMYTLLSHRREWERLCADLSLMPDAIEEIVRYETVVGLMPRVATTDMTIEGVAVPEGTNVVLLIGAGNRDPLAFEDPDRFDLLRRPVDHLGFGYASHFCLGASLARMEATVAFTAIATKYPRLELAVAPKEIDWRAKPASREILALPVGVGA